MTVCKFDSVIAVPPMARHADAGASPVFNDAANDAILDHLRRGGITSVLYGGNAVFYHLSMAEFEQAIDYLAKIHTNDFSVTPSIGPSFGTAWDQAAVLADQVFDTVMVLPTRDVVDDDGIATGVRRLAERVGKPLVLYVKFDRWLAPSLIRRLEQDGCLSWIKYAVVRDNPGDDTYLREITDQFPRERIISGIGEQPAAVHMDRFGVAGFTSGCVCVDPAASMRMLSALRGGDLETAESVRRHFEPLEDLRNEISPIRVLHHAVDRSNIAPTGPMPPMLSALDPQQISRIDRALEQIAQQTA